MSFKFHFNTTEDIPNIAAKRVFSIMHDSWKWNSYKYQKGKILGQLAIMWQYYLAKKEEKEQVEPFIFKFN